MEVEKKYFVQIHKDDYPDCLTNFRKFCYTWLLSDSLKAKINWLTSFHELPQCFNYSWLWSLLSMGEADFTPNFVQSFSLLSTVSTFPYALHPIFSHFSQWHWMAGCPGAPQREHLWIMVAHLLNLQQEPCTMKWVQYIHIFWISQRYVLRHFF